MLPSMTAVLPLGTTGRIDLPRPRWKMGFVASAAVLALMDASTPAGAVTLGPVHVRSALGEPLRAEIEISQLSAADAESFRARVAPPLAFSAVGVAMPPAIADARVSLQRRPSGEAFLRLVSDTPIHEQFPAVVIDARWDHGNIVRDYTLLVDAPTRGARPAVTPAGATQLAASLPAASPAPRWPLTEHEAYAAARENAAAFERTIAALAFDEHEAGLTSTTPRAAPRVVPARPVNRALASASSAGRTVAGATSTRTVQRGDTALTVLAGLATGEASREQMLAALVRANPDAFIRGNINLLRAGVVLVLPTAEQALAIPEASARRSLLAQTRGLQTQRPRLAKAPPATQTAQGEVHAAGAPRTRTLAPTENQPTASQAPATTAAAGARQVAADLTRFDLLPAKLALARQLARSGDPAQAAQAAQDAAALVAQLRREASIIVSSAAPSP